MTPRQAGELVELLTRLVLLGEAAEQHLRRLVEITEALEARLGQGPDDDRPAQPLGLVPPRPGAPGGVVRIDPAPTAPPTREDGHPRPARRRSRPWA